MSIQLDNIIQCPSTQYLAQVEANLRVSDALFNYCKQLRTLDLIDPISLSIINSAYPLCRLAMCLQVIYSLRLSEIHHVDLNCLLFGKSQTIIQPKTKAFKFLPSIDLSSFIRQTDIHDNISILPMSHSSYIERFKNIVPLFVQQILIDEHDRSHVFRHLQASFMKSQNIPLDIISAKLGHSDSQSVRAYLHNDLINYFHSFK